MPVASRRVHRRFGRRPGLVALLIVVGAAAGCAGGGGGGGAATISTSGGSGFPANPLVIIPRSTFHTAEYNENYGLAAINASAAYAVGGTGQDVTVAIIDTGIDIDHPDLVANIDPRSIDIASATSLELDDHDGHGTGVAGIVAASKNDSGMHGVAYRARILAIRADGATEGQCAETTCGFPHHDLADAIDYAVAHGARIINLSLGGAVLPTADYETALRDAVDAGVIVVAASGNSRAAEPLYPARFAGTAISDGLILAVGAVDQTNADSKFHNLPAATAAYFVVAPGVNVVTTDVGGGLQTVSGTSFSAPHVSGALALLLDVFPTLTPQQAVTLLLATATDLGAAGTDGIFGRGLVNLDAAMRPQGTLGIPQSTEVSGPRTDAASTSLALGTAFGDALGNDPLLGHAIALDAYDRPYAIDLGGSIQPAERMFDLEGMLRRDRYRTVGLPLAGGKLSLSMGLRDDWTAVDDEPFGMPDDGAETSFDNVRLNAMLGQDLGLRLGHGIAAEQQLAPNRLRSGRSGLFWADEELLAPHLGLVERGDHIGVDQRLDSATALSFDYFRTSEHQDLEDGAGEGEIVQVALSHRFAWGLGVKFGIASFAEDDAFLNSHAAGGFGAIDGSSSRFYTLSAVMPVTSGLTAFAGVTAGRTEMPAVANGLLSDWSTVESSAFGFGLVRTGLLAVDDRLGFMVGQPLRVEQASATLSVPVARGLDGRIHRQTERVQLRPSGRELDFQLAYDREILPGWAMSSWLMMRLEPGHREAAAPAVGAGISLRLEL